MSLTVPAGTYLVTASTGASPPLSVGGVVAFTIYVGGVQVASSSRTVTSQSALTSQEAEVSTQAVVTVAAGQSIELRWRAGGLGVASASERTLVAQQVDAS
jgi:hypothetical protein